MFGLYVHIPFCNKICNYCDFYKMKVSDEFQTRVIEKLLKEFDLNEKISDHIDTVYIGGGTPSCISYVNLEKILKRIKEFVIKNNKLYSLMEYTIELNPEDINERLLGLLKKYEISRVSIGVQSFNPLIQRVIGRYTDYEQFKKKIALLKTFNFTNYNLDFMYGIMPKENYDELALKQDLEKFINLNPAHISCYSLILETKTILGEKARKGFFKKADDDFEASCYYKIRDILSKNNFIQYETSNFSIDGYQSIHNQIYWNNDHYLGIGPSSASYIENKRYQVCSNINMYMDSIDKNMILTTNIEELTIKDMMEYEVILGLRKVSGINEQEFHKKFNQDLLTSFPKINEMLKNKYLLKKGLNIFLNPTYYYVQNYIISEII